MSLYNSFYLAAPSELQDKARAFIRIMLNENMFCTSRWIEQVGVGTVNWNMHTPDKLVQSAIEDAEDVKNARTLIMLNPLEFKSSGTGGRHVELGIALAMDKTIFLVGAITNIFHWHPSVRVLKDDNLEDTARRIGAYVREVELGRPTNRG